MEVRNYIDFEVIKERWNVYNLHDGTKVKIRNMLHSAWYTEDSQGNKIFN